MLRSIDKPLTDLVGQLEYGDIVANTVAEAHRDTEHSAVIATCEGRVWKGREYIKEVHFAKMSSAFSLTRLGLAGA